MWNRDSPVSVVSLHWWPRRDWSSTGLCPQQLSLGPRADNVTVPLDLTQLSCPGFTLAAGFPSGFTTDGVGCREGSPVENLQSHMILTMSHWSSGLTCLLPATRFISPGGYLCETGILLLALSCYKPVFVYHSTLGISHSVFIKFVIISSRRFLPFDVLSHSVFITFVLNVLSSLCTIWRFVLSTFFYHSTFFLSTFCPVQCFVCRRFLSSAFFSSTFCRWICRLAFFYLCFGTVLSCLCTLACPAVSPRVTGSSCSSACFPVWLATSGLPLPAFSPVIFLLEVRPVHLECHPSWRPDQEEMQSCTEGCRAVGMSPWTLGLHELTHPPTSFTYLLLHYMSACCCLPGCLLVSPPFYSLSFFRSNPKLSWQKAFFTGNF